MKCFIGSPILSPSFSPIFLTHLCHPSFSPIFLTHLSHPSFSPIFLAQNETGQQTCTSCPIGKIASDKSASACAVCPAGRVGVKPGGSLFELDCIACPSGQFSDFSTGDLSTTDLSDSSNGPVSCTRCNAGQHAKTSGKSEAKEEEKHRSIDITSESDREDLINSILNSF